MQTGDGKGGGLDKRQAQATKRRRIARQPPARPDAKVIARSGDIVSQKRGKTAKARRKSITYQETANSEILQELKGTQMKSTSEFKSEISKLLRDQWNQLSNHDRWNQLLQVLYTIECSAGQFFERILDDPIQIVLTTTNTMVAGGLNEKNTYKQCKK